MYNKMSATQKAAFTGLYLKRRKSSFYARLWWILLGAHYAYLGRWGIQIGYWLLLIVGVVFTPLLILWGVWAIIDFLTMGVKTGNYNSDMADHLAVHVKAMASA